MRTFATDDGGGVLATVVVFAAALSVMLGLVVDVGRTYAEQMRLQTYLDSVAVAAAAELDGEPDAIDRAKWVIAHALPERRAAFSTGAGDRFAVDQTRFLSEAPDVEDRALDLASIAGRVTTDPAAATHVLLTARERSVPWSFLRLLSDADRHDARFRFGAWAAATPIRGETCMTPLLAMCAPAGASTEALGTPGRQLRLRKGLDDAWQPGEYGLIADLRDDPARSCAGLTGSARAVCLLAIDTHESTCKDTIRLTNGAGTQVGAALDTRFDIWGGAAAALRSNAHVSSDENTIAGELYTCEAPDFDAVSASYGLPVDPCFDDGGCETLSGVVAAEDLELYWARTHGGALPEALRGGARYETYRHEIANRFLDPRGPEQSAVNSCNAASSARENRRVFQMAVIDCGALAGAGGGADGTGASGEDIPVEAYAEVFLTNPVARPQAFVATFDGPDPARLAAAGDPMMRAGDAPTAAAAPSSGPGASYAAYSDAGIAAISARPSRLAVDRLGAAAAAEAAAPMLLDTATAAGRGADMAHTTFGNMLIVSSDGASADPNPADAGGWLIVTFSAPADIVSVRVFATARGGVIRLYDSVVADPEGEFAQSETGFAPLWPGEAHDPREISHVAVPALGDGRSATVAIGASGVRTLAYFLPDRGALDDLVYSSAQTPPPEEDTLLLETIRLIEPRPTMTGVYPVLSD